MTPAELARLLATAGDYRRRYELSDARIAAIVLLSSSAAIGPVAALRWSAADVIRASPDAPDHWTIRPSVPHRGIAQVIPIDCRAALLIYLRHAIATQEITTLAAPRFFPLSLRAIQIDLTTLLRRAGLADRGITFHALKRQPTAQQEREHTPPQSVKPAARGKSEQKETERPPAPHPAIQTADGPRRSPPKPRPA